MSFKSLPTFGADGLPGAYNTTLAILGAPFSPVDLPGLTLWLDASDADTITKDGSDLVSAWNDKSGNARNFTYVSGTKPTWQSAQLNGNPGILFNGSSTRLEHSGANVLSTAAASYIITVFQRTGYVEQYPRLLNLTTNDVNKPFSITFTYSGDTNYSPIAISSGDYKKFRINGSDTQIDTNPHVMVVTYNGGGVATGTNWDLDLDWVDQPFYNTAPGTTSNAAAISTIGCTEWTSTSRIQHFQGRVYEVMAGIGALSESDIASLNSYITAKWGL